MMELSLNEVESLAAKAARGAGFAWGLAEDLGRAARLLAQGGDDWSAALLVLLDRAPGFAAPGAANARDEAPLCPVRTAALLNDAPPEAGALVLHDVGLPVWLDALVKTQGIWRVEADLSAARADVTLTRGASPAPALARRATLSRPDLDALNAYAARTYVPESDRSRSRGAGGKSVDDE